MDQNPAELLKSILNTIERHPNAKVSKLIKCFEVEKTPQNIALLLIELAEHPEFSADITISLKYYLDCFNKLHQEPSFAEAGIVLFNSSKIYAKRVDHIHHEIERLILSLSNVENTEQNVANPDKIQDAVKVKRGRKRTLEQIDGTIEAQMSAKRFKKLSNSKRFEGVTSKRNNIMKTLVQDSDKSVKTYIPQSTWQYSAIEDFDYEDEVDSKKNYKLFTYHLEHRYNTLIPDINFKMYFKIKDLINDNSNDSELPESWPPLSDAYIEQFLDLEDVILQKEGHLGKTREKMDASRLKDHCNVNFNKSNAENFNNTNTTMDSGIDFDANSSVHTPCSQTQQGINSQNSICESDSSSKSLDSGIGLENSIQSQTIDESQFSLLENNGLTGDALDISKSGTGSDKFSQSPEMYEQMVKDLSALRNEQKIQENEEAITVTKSDPTLLEPSTSHQENDQTLPDPSRSLQENDPTLLDPSRSLQENDTTLLDPSKSHQENDSTLLDFSKSHQDSTLLDSSMPHQENDPTLLDPSSSHEEDLSTLKIILPHLPDEGIYFSDLDEKYRQMLSPAVVTQDVFRCIKDKSNIVITVDDAIEQLFKIKQPSHEILSIPLYERPHFLLNINILKIPLKYFNKQRRFKLGPEFELLKKDRLKKYIKRSSLTTCPTARKLMRITKDVTVTVEHISPPATPSYEPDWLGFPEESLIDKNRTLSRDSGISLQPTDRENIEDFLESPDLLSSTLKPMALDNESNQLQDTLKSPTNVPEEIPVVLEKPSTEAILVSLEKPPTEEIPVSLENPSTEGIPVSIEEPSTNIDEVNNPSVGDKVVPNCDKTNTNGSIDNQSNQLYELNEENRVRKKVHDWHSHLQPILACSRERHHFDVFAIGTEIMTQFDRNDVCSEKVSFKNVMEEKDESLISRYFLSMLLLANQGNIIIDVQNKSTNAPSELHDIRLKLMSRNRNIVSLEDNIGLRPPPASKTQIDEQPVNAIVRTLKGVPEVPKMDDRDSGIAMSEASIV